MSSMPSRSVRPLQDSGIPDGPKRITTRPPRGVPAPTIILERLILIVLRDGLVYRRRERSPPGESGADPVRAQTFKSSTPFNAHRKARFHGQDPEDEPSPPARRARAAGGLPQGRGADLAGRRRAPRAVSKELVGGQPVAAQPLRGEGRTDCRPRGGP